MGRPKKLPEPTTPVTPFDDEAVAVPTVPAPGDPIADYVDPNNPEHANLTYAELQELAHRQATE